LNTELRTAVANIKSQIKRNRQNEKRRLRNKSARSEMKTRVKRVIRAADVDPTADETVVSLQAAVKRLDKGAAQGIIHKNQASNRKSALMRRVAALQTAALSDE
jgi:small subunit ribosomal protein S20